MKQKLICISCPVGCLLEVTKDDAGKITVTGNACKRGVVYGKKEITAPARTVTSTVAVRGGQLPLCAVRTQTDIPKDKIFACMDEIRAARVNAPVHIGDVIIENVAGTGAAVVATASVAKEQEGNG